MTKPVSPPDTGVELSGPTTTRGDGGARSLDADPLLGARVHAVAQHLVSRLADAAVEDMRARYDLGDAFCILRRLVPRVVSAPILNSVARWMRVHPSALRRYARATETIGRPEFEHLSDLRTRRGSSLTWSHVERLALELDAPRRRELAAAIVDEDLSVRALAARLKR
jgi:hypothetical protein